MRRLVVLPLVLFAMLPATPHAASGGGWWSSPNIESRYLVVGERVAADVEVLFRSAAAAANAPAFYAYLLPDLDWRIVDEAMRDYPPGRWWREPARKIRVGRVEIVERDSNLVRARTEFSVPDLPPGGYALMLCDLGCARPLGNEVMPVRMRLVDSVQAKALSQRLDRVRARVATKVRRARNRLEDAIYGTQDRAASEAEVRFLRERVIRLENGLERISTRPEPGTDWRPVLVAGLLGAAGAATITRRRRIEVLVPVPQGEPEVNSRRRWSYSDH